MIHAAGKNVKASKGKMFEEMEGVARRLVGEETGVSS